MARQQPGCKSPLSDALLLWEREGVRLSRPACSAVPGTPSTQVGQEAWRLSHPLLHPVHAPGRADTALQGVHEDVHPSAAASPVGYLIQAGGLKWGQHKSPWAPLLGLLFAVANLEMRTGDIDFGAWTPESRKIKFKTWSLLPGH